MNNAQSMDAASKTDGSAETQARRAAMAVYAAAETLELKACLNAIGLCDYEDLREPETGLVMIRGRIGGDGAFFNLGEATVTRAAVRLPAGRIGYSYLFGRDREKARLAALCDALWQEESTRGAVEMHILAPVQSRLIRERAQRDGETAATRVDFFTMVRGEDNA